MPDAEYIPIEIRVGENEKCFWCGLWSEPPEVFYTYASSGAYDAVAKTLFAKENVHAYFLEFDDARSGGFEPLKEVTPDKKVVLGLVTTKLAKLEDKETVIARIKEASQYVPLENLYLSPQCGFASCEIGNKLTEEQQWAKVKLVKEIAEEVWG